MPPQKEFWMRRAFELAGEGLAHAEPNPYVGAVLVNDAGEIVGEGAHLEFGGPHAEIEALKAAGPKAKGSTLFINLEPCCHQGKTPPCTEALIAASVRKVVAAMEDPNPHVQGKGFQRLREAGIVVETGLLEAEAKKLNADFIRRIETGEPFLTVKWAMSLDGKIASHTGNSQWISGEASRTKAHLMRALSDGILTGIGTVLADDPRLTVRHIKGKNPPRIVVDSYARMPLDCNLIKTIDLAPLFVAVTPKAPAPRVKALQDRGVTLLEIQEDENGVDLSCLLEFLKNRGLRNLLLEAGGDLIASAFEKNLVNKVAVFVAPLIIGGKEAPSPVGGKGIALIHQARHLGTLKIRPFAPDYLLEALVAPSQKEAVENLKS